MFRERLKRRIRQNNHDIEFTEDEVSNICRTFDSCFCEWNENNIKLIKDKAIFIDKFNMVLNKVITILYKLWLEHDIKIYMFGDPNHCNPVEGGSQIYYNYLESISVRQMCPNQKY